VARAQREEGEGREKRCPETAGAEEKEGKDRNCDLYYKIPSLDEQGWLKYKFVPTERLRRRE